MFTRRLSKYLAVLIMAECVCPPNASANNIPAKKKVLVTHYDVPREALQRLMEVTDVIFNEEKPYPSYEEIKAKIKGVDGIFWISKHRLDKGLIDAAGPQLNSVATMSAGVDNIDVPYLKSRGIKLGNTPQVLNNAVASQAIMLALMAGRRAKEGEQTIKNSTWTFGPQWLLGYDLTFANIGIVGFGEIGQTIAKRLQGFEVTTYYTGHKPKEEAEELKAKFVTLDKLLEVSDFVFVAVPLTNETKGMFNKDLFKKMKKTAVFVNIARGAVVNQDDLVEALQNGTIFAAGLDVMTPEPLPCDHVLLTLPNCVLTPHTGSATFETRLAMADIAAKNLIMGVHGGPMFSPVY